MTDLWRLNHWVYSQMKDQEPRCTGEIVEYDRDANFIYGLCDSCSFDVGVALRPSRDLVASGTDGYDRDARTQSSSEREPF